MASKIHSCSDRNIPIYPLTLKGQKGKDLGQKDKSGLQVLHAAWYSASKGRDFPWHEHSVWELIYYRRGHIDALIGEARYRTRPGSILLIPPQTPHAEIAHTSYANIAILLSIPPDWTLPESLIDDAYSSFRYITDAVAGAWRQQQGIASDMLQPLSTLLGIMLQNAQRTHTLPPVERVVHQAERIIEERYSLPLTIKEVAHEIGVSPLTLRSYFMERRNYSAHDYLVEVRLGHAMNLLLESNLGLEDIALACGYYDSSHLTRHIKRVTGETPHKLRIRQLQSNIDISTKDR